VITLPDVPAIDRDSLSPELRAAIAELLLTMADDEFVQGFRDSEWTGIAPMLEEDVAFSSLAQDELGHARVLYGLLAAIGGDDPDRIAYERQPPAYRHCRLLDHPRGDWAFSIARRYLYDTADAVRLEALRDAAWAPLAEVLAKIRREEAYHLMHLEAWIDRLANGGEEARRRLDAALATLWPDAATPFAPLQYQDVLLASGILEVPMSELADRHRDRVITHLAGLQLPLEPGEPSTRGGRVREPIAEGFFDLWSEFTMVRRSEPDATW
jgi:ring-1,2-phenylacetyl-CoA epoxidase subunit PaaC